VFITENEINFLAFPNVPRSLIVFGAGYGWSALREARWMEHCELHYWGDIDTHGFSILDQLRKVFPHAQSFLMDTLTFESFRHLCSTEPSPVTRELHRLNPEESQVFNILLNENSLTKPRLEQERIPFSRLASALNSLPTVQLDPPKA
jgi:hypothetical protein